MSPLKVELFMPDTDKWVALPEINPGDQPGSVSSNNLDGSRDIYVFGVDQDADHKRFGFIARSLGGIDLTTADNSQRVTGSVGLEPVARLNIGESLELNIRTDVSAGYRRRLRFSYYD